MFIRHVSGAKNTVADWLSRMHAYVSSEKINLLSAGHLDVACLMGSMLEYPGMREPVVQFAEESNLVFAAGQEKLPEQKVWTAEEMFKEVHGGRKLHWGARRTWQALNKRFPGHAISFRQIEDMVATCPICQKDRLGMDAYVEPIYRHLKKTSPRGAVGVDLLTVTPVDDAGNTCLIVVVVFYTPSTSGRLLPRSTRRTRWQLRYLRSSAPSVCTTSYGPILALTSWPR